MRILVMGGAMPDPARVVPAELEAALTRVVARLADSAVEHTPDSHTSRGSTGKARGSIKGEVRMGSPVAPGVPVGVVGSPEIHVAVLNDGRRPGQKPPPSDALELWVRRTIQWSGRRGPRGGRRRLSAAEARSLAYVIARAIGRRGTPPLHMFEKAVAENEAWIGSVFEEAGYRISLRMAEGG